MCEILLVHHTHTHARNRFTALWILSGTTRIVPGEPVPEETFTHSHISWLSIVPDLLHPSTVIHGILPVQSTHWQSFSTISVQVFFGLPLAWHSPLHTPYISSPNHCLLFATRAHTIATCFAVVPILYVV